MTKVGAPQDGDAGFTLIELLVVILIMGILAAVALPAFLTQRDKGRDASAKSNARNMVSQLEACFRNTDGYVGCTAELTAASTSLPIGAGRGQLRIVSEGARGFQISAVSETGNSFVIDKDEITGVVTHSCTSTGTARGGCNNGVW